MKSTIRDARIDIAKKFLASRLQGAKPDSETSLAGTVLDHEGFIVEPGHPCAGMHLLDCQGGLEDVEREMIRFKCGEKMVLFRCPGCGMGALAQGLTRHEERRIVDGCELRGVVETTTCTNCRHTTSTLDDFLLRAAHELIKRGLRSGAAFKLMREALGLLATDLANMLEVSPETLSRWENDVRLVKPAEWAIIATLVVERIEGQGQMASILRAMKNPPVVGEIHVEPATAAQLEQFNKDKIK